MRADTRLAMTRAIDLRGDERAIDSVEFFYARGRWGYGREPRVRL